MKKILCFGNVTDKYKNAIEKGDCYIYDNCFMLWTFPVSIMTALKHTYILTYMFKIIQYE